MKKTAVHSPTVASRAPSPAAIRRAVASSTAIETGQPVKSIECTLRAAKSKFGHLKLAS